MTEVKLERSMNGPYSGLCIDGPMVGMRREHPYPIFDCPRVVDRVSDSNPEHPQVEAIVSIAEYWNFHLWRDRCGNSFDVWVSEPIRGRSADEITFYVLNAMGKAVTSFAALRGNK
jgi:hypothetical protein